MGNIGNACLDIRSALITFQEQTYELLIDDIDKFFCPQDVVTFIEERPLDLCSLAGNSVFMNLTLISETNDEFSVQSSLTFPALPPVQNPSTSPVYPSPAPYIGCGAMAQRVWFVFESRPCEDSANTQFERRFLKGSNPKSKGGSSGKFKSDCIDYCRVSPPAKIVITSLGGSILLYDGIVNTGDKFSIASGESEFGIIHVHIYNIESNRNAQSFLIDLSCDLSCDKGVATVGETFGSLKISHFEHTK